MRIISGDLKGKTILFPQKSIHRPTSDNIKEALFNILSSMDGKAFLDIFAGSGNIGIEALSRGVSRVTFIEKDIRLASLIRLNLQRCGIKSGYDIINRDLISAGQILQRQQNRYDILFADPPYEKGLVKETLIFLGDGKLCHDHSSVIIQHSIREGLTHLENFKLTLNEQRRYGDTILSFFNLRVIED